MNEINHRHRHLLDGSRRLCAARDSRLKISANHKRNCSLRKGPACQLNKKQHAHKATTTFLVVLRRAKKKGTPCFANKKNQSHITFNIIIIIIFYRLSFISNPPSPSPNDSIHPTIILNESAYHKQPFSKYNLNRIELKFKKQHRFRFNSKKLDDKINNEDYNHSSSSFSSQ